MLAWIFWVCQIYTPLLYFNYFITWFNIVLSTHFRVYPVWRAYQQLVPKKKLFNWAFNHQDTNVCLDDLAVFIILKHLSLSDSSYLSIKFLNVKQQQQSWFHFSLRRYIKAIDRMDIYRQSIEFMRMTDQQQLINPQLWFVYKKKTRSICRDWSFSERLTMSKLLTLSYYKMYSQTKWATKNVTMMMVGKI